MKNLKVLTDKQEIKDYVYSLWSTEEFKNSHNQEGGYINRIVDQLSDYPRFVADMTNSDIEWAQFYSYFNILIKRKYYNKVIQDLYYLHEMIHMATMLYCPNLDFEFWQKKMIDNEMDASVESEILVYQELNIRDKAFNFEIWSDTLPKELLADRNALIQHRFSRMKNPTTKVEITLNKYFTNNKVWVEIWKKNYNKVEAALADFHHECHDSKEEAVKKYLEFIKENTTDDIMFKEEAEKFSKIYLNNY